VLPLRRFIANGLSNKGLAKLTRIRYTKINKRMFLGTSGILVKESPKLREDFL